MVMTVMIVVVAALLAAGVTQFGFVQITQMRVKNELNLFAVLESIGLYSREKFESLPKKEITLTSVDGLKLCGSAIEAHPDSKRWMIIVHGYTGSRAVSTQFIDMFTDEGFNILLIDQRRHGQSEGQYTTYGYYEKFDIDCWVKWIAAQYGKDVEIGLHGQSLGGGTVLEYLTIAAPQVKFVIADCPYSDLSDLMRHQMTTLNKVPHVPFFRWVNNRIRKKAGFSFDQVSPIRSVQNSRLPVLFIHGANDNYVPTRMSVEMYEAKPEPKRLVLIEGAIHANAYHVGKEQYRQEVHSFIEEVMGEAEVQLEPHLCPVIQQEQPLNSI